MQALRLLRIQAHANRLANLRLNAAMAPLTLDEFLMPREPHLRVAEMAALGWSETAIYESIYGS